MLIRGHVRSRCLTPPPSLVQNTRIKSVQGGVQTFPILHGKPLSAEQFEALVPKPLDADGIERRRELEDIHEELLLSILALEEEWQLDNRIAFSLRQRNAA